MRKIYFIIYFALSSLIGFTQETDSTKIKEMKEEVPQIVILPTDVDNDEQSQDISGLLQSSNDIFVSTAGYTFGQTRFKIRGYQSENTSVLINGVQLNDMETGRAYWSSWGGLNDATRHKEVESGVAKSYYSFGGVGGVTNMIARASAFSKTIKFTYSLTNRAYRDRIMFTASTGLMKNGWAFAFNGSRRWAQEGYVEGTFYDAWSYFVSAEKKFNNKHSIGLIAYAAPTKRGKNGVSTQEAYDLAGTNYYNPYWGYQNGEKRNSRISNYNQPMIILSHYWTMDSKTQLTSSLYYSFGRGGSSTLDWYDAADPRPDYYRNLPSFDGNNNGYTPSQRMNLWQNDESFRQLDFDYFYFVNRKNLYTLKNVDGVAGQSYTGNLSNYIIGEYRDDKSNIGASINFKKELNEHITFSAGIDLSLYKGFQYMIVDDLLGGDFYLNVDKFAERDYADPIKAQNDLNDPNRVVKVGDKYGYYYTANINNYDLYAQGAFSYSKIDFYIGATASYNEFWRTGHMRNGKFPNDSYGDSDKNNFTNFGFKAGATYKITGRNFIEANAIAMTRAPFFRDAYISPRTRNETVSGLTNEKIISGDIGYIYRSPYVKARVTGYYTKFTDGIYSRSYYHETLQSFVNYQMVGVDEVHYGIELGIDGKLTQTISLHGVLAAGRNYYDSRPEATISIDNSAAVLSNRTVYLKNYWIGGSPQTAASVGIKYTSPHYIYVGIDGNYYDDMYLEPNPDRRTAEAVTNYSPENPERDVILEQEKLKAGYTLDAYIGKSWKIEKYYISLNFSVDNILDTQDLAFGGFEQFRYDPLDINKFPSKYFYLYGRQYYLNLSFRF